MLASAGLLVNVFAGKGIRVNADNPGLAVTERCSKALKPKPAFRRKRSLTSAYARCRSAAAGMLPVLCTAHPF